MRKSTQVRGRGRRRSHDANRLSTTVCEAVTLDAMELVANWPSDPIRSNFGLQYLKDEFESKFLDPTRVPANVRAKAAIEKWLSTDKRNERTNRRMFLAECDVGVPDFGWVTEPRLVAKTAKIIFEILGPLDISRVYQKHAVTNGASTRIRRGPWAAAEKCDQTAHVSRSAQFDYMMVAQNTELPHDLIWKDESVMFTVPKKTEIDRVACKEPEGNMILQRSAGLFIRQRLKRVGIDLRDQTRNQLLAKTGMFDGLATIDLSSASDSISYEVVKRLLPPDWFSFLDDIRVGTTTLPNGHFHHMEMFSTMGNGFTFELETLLFYALARATAWFSGKKGVISVYGDDIIIPSSLAPRFKRVMDWFGFKLNAKKSFWNSPFRESCGGHYYNGTDVSPLYLRERVKGKTDLIRLLNGLAEWDTREHNCPWILSDYFRPFWEKWSRHIPHDLRGGWDFRDPTRLVTGDPPRKRLVLKQRNLREKEPERLNRGLMNLWFLAKTQSPTADIAVSVVEGNTYGIAAVNPHHEPQVAFFSKGPLSTD